MSESARAVAERGTDVFNRDLGRGTSEIAEDVRAVWAPEPVIAPFRSLLEGTEYSGSTALDEFVAATLESWTHVKFENREFRDIDAQRVLMLADLVGQGRESGVETRASGAVIFVVRKGRIAEARTYANEEDARSELSR
jgi:hypothetical protein